MTTSSLHSLLLRATSQRLVTSALLLVLLSGCSTLSKPQPESIPKPSSVSKIPAKWQASYHAANAQPQYWLHDFQTTELPKLVNKALAYNHDLGVMRTRMDAARAQSAIVSGSRLPNASISADASRRGSNNHSGSSFNIGASVSWEADLWGRLGNDVKASVITAQAAQSDYRSAQLALAASVARNWFVVIENKMQLLLAKRTENNFRQSLGVIEDRYKSGLTSALDVRLLRSSLASSRNTVAARKRGLDGSIRTLEVLLGDYPKASLKTTQTLPRLSAKIPAGLPSQLLARRPDLVAAELRLSAAGERLESAKKNRLPSIRLTGSTGTSSTQLKDLLNWDSLVWNLLSGISQPFLQGKRLSAEEALKRAQHKEAWFVYAQSVLNALSEVETGLAADIHFAEQERSLQLAVKEATLSFNLATDRYTSGLENITTLLDTQRRLFTAESTLLQTRLARLDSRVQLYLALGGDFHARNSTLKQK